MPSLLGILLILVSNASAYRSMDIFYEAKCKEEEVEPWVLANQKQNCLSESRGKVTFNDVAGIDEAKEEVEEIVEFLKNPRKFQKT